MRSGFFYAIKICIRGLHSRQKIYKLRVSRFYLLNLNVDFNIGNIGVPSKNVGTTIKVGFVCSDSGF